LQLKDAAAGNDQAFDRVLESAINNAPEEKIGAKLAEVAKDKGLGEEIGEKVKEHRGAIILGLVDVGMEIIKKVVG
jgi:hypothetical protein